MHVRLFDVDPRPVDRIRDAEPVADDVAITCMIAPRRRIEPGAADDEPRPPVADDDRRRHHAREAPTRLGRAGADEVVLAEHVVELDAGAGTITPEPEPVDDETEAAFPSASTTET